MKKTLNWALRLIVAVLVWLHLDGSEGAGRVVAVYFTVMATLGVFAAVFLVPCCFVEAGRAALRARKAGWPRCPIFGWIWSAASVGYLAWTGHQWLAGTLLLVSMLLEIARAAAHDKEPVAAVGS